MSLSEISLFLLPITLGFGTSMLFTKNTKLECGTVSPLVPPGWVFSVAWSLLYLLIGFSCVLFLRAREFQGLYLNLILVVALVIWWVVFANLCAPIEAFIAILLLVALAFGIVCVHFKKSKNPLTAWSLLPLVLWLSFASYLTYYTIG